MNTRKVLGATVFALFVVLCITARSFSVLAQSSAQPDTQVKDDETNLDTQLYLIVATNQEVDDAKLPVSLDLVIRQLRASLPFKNYRLAATLVNRVKNEGRLNLRWIGGPFATPSGSASAATPSFSDFNIRTVRLVRDNAGQQIVQMAGFSYGARIPIQTGTAIAMAAGPSMFSSSNKVTFVTQDDAAPREFSFENLPLGAGCVLGLSPKGALVACASGHTPSGALAASGPTTVLRVRRLGRTLPLTSVKTIPFRDMRALP